MPLWHKEYMPAILPINFLYAGKNIRFRQVKRARRKVSTDSQGTIAE